MRYLETLNDDPLPWLLGKGDPAVRHLALRELCDLPAGDPEVTAAQRKAMAAHPILPILNAQEPEGWWAKPGAGYSPKYRATVWQLIFLDELGADGTDRRIAAAREYVLAHTQAVSGGFAASGAKSLSPPPPARVLHCLNGNLVAALIGLGHPLTDPRLQAAIDWQAKAITGGVDYYPQGTAGPGFLCGANDGQACAWGAIKAMNALARIPAAQRSRLARRALRAGTAFLLSHNPARADYPMGYGNIVPSRLWFKLGFPLGYSSDIVENLQVLSDLGYGEDPRLADAWQWLLSKQDDRGRFRNENTFAGRMWTNLDQHSRLPSKWVTLRVCRLLKSRARSVSEPVRVAVG
ncbi:hypothetical protein [Catelliglobosispora koreensis]|uniref:hypothetical protein n=1 Tax=Catelliglobosispora koreensis TaxID=129052 RepID=UPI00036E831D|nr:hypothetical protein [Catelliglobosispora koreensis]